MHSIEKQNDKPKIEQIREGSVGNRLIFVNLNTKELPFETQQQIIQQFYSDNVQEQIEAFDVFARYCQEHYPDSILYPRIQEAIDALFQNPTINETVLHNIILIVDSIGSDFTDHFDRCLYVSKIWGMMPNPEIAISISNIIIKYDEPVDLILSEQIAPTLTELLSNPELNYQSTTISILSTIFKHRNDTGRANRFIPILFEIAKSSQINTIQAQCFELFPEFVHIDPQMFVGPMANGLFSQFETYNNASFKAAGLFIAQICGPIDVVAFVNNTVALPMLSAALKVDDLAQAGAISAIFSIIAKYEAGSQLIFESVLAEDMLNLQNMTSHAIWMSVLRILCIMCVSLDDDHTYEFAKRNLGMIIIESLDSTPPTIVLELLGALRKIIGCFVARNDTQKLEEILMNDSLPSNLEIISSETDNEFVKALCTQLLNIIDESIE